MTDGSPMRLLGMRADWRGLRRTSLSLGPGLNVLFGLNGAGKTALIHCLSSGLRGTQVGGGGVVSLLVSGYPRGQDGSPLLVDRRRGDTESTSGESLRGALAAQVDAASGKFGWQSTPELLAALAQGLASDPVALMPVGTSDARWRVHCLASSSREVVAAAMSAERDAIQGILDDYRRVWQKAERDADQDAFEDGYAVCVDRWVELRNSGLFAHELREHWKGGDEPSPFFDDQFGVPVVSVGEVSGLTSRLPYLIDESGSQGQVDAETRELASRLVVNEFGVPAGTRYVNAEGTGFWHPSLTAWCDTVADRANWFYSRLLLDAPTLRLGRGRFQDWVRGDGLRWLTGDLPLDLLSRAQQRWAAVAIRLALLAENRDLSQRGGILMLDEPEAALHRTAEEHMAQGLGEISRDLELQVVVASHSPALLDSVGAQVSRVFRASEERSFLQAAGSWTRVEPLAEIHRSDLASLGLPPSDLLRRRKAILLVEGHHDELILRALIGQKLGRLGVEIVPLHGGRTLPDAIDSRLLFDFTDALIIPVVDNGNPRHISDLWERAITVAATEGVEAAGGLIRAELPHKASAENKFLGTFLSRAIEEGLQSRVVPHAFSKGDIIEYLPVEAFVKHRTWEELRDRYRQERPDQDFKTWLGKTFGSTFDDATLLGAVEAMDRQVPQEFVSLLDLCAAHTSAPLSAANDR